MRIYVDVSVGQTRAAGWIRTLESYGFGEMVCPNELPARREPFAFDNAVFRVWNRGRPSGISDTWVWGLSQWIGSGWCAQPAWEEQAAGAEKTSGLEDLRSNPEYKRRPNLCPPMGVQGARARGTTTSEHEQRTDLTGHRGVTGRRFTDLSPSAGWAKRPHLSHGGGQGVSSSGLREQIPSISGDSGATGRGVHGSRLRKLPHLSGAHGNAGAGVHASGLGRTEGLYDWMNQLQARLRWVRVCCGDFERVLGPSVTEKIGVTAVLLDPPYKPGAGRDPSIYAEEDLTAADRAREWALENGGNPKLRIALCGYEGEHDMPSTWRCVPWKASGGYAAAAGNHENSHRERVWLSPACLPVDAPHPEQGQLFQEAAHG